MSGEATDEDTPGGGFYDRPASEDPHPKEWPAVRALFGTLEPYCSCAQGRGCHGDDCPLGHLDDLVDALWPPDTAPDDVVPLARL